MKSQIKKWGNSAAIRLPARILAAAGLEAGSSVRIEAIDNKVIIEASVEPGQGKIKLPFTEKELIAGLTPYKAHADELAEPTREEVGE